MAIAVSREGLQVIKFKMQIYIITRQLHVRMLRVAFMVRYYIMDYFFREMLWEVIKC